MRRVATIVCFGIVAMVVSGGCARQISSNVYSGASVGETSTTYPGVIIGARQVTVEDKKYPTGIKIVLKFKNSKDSVINNIKRISKPGRRVYISATKIPTVKRGRSEVIISTSQGVMAGAEAFKKGLGGEIICEVE